MRRKNERGMATAEYSVGTVGAVFFAFWLWRLAGRLGDPDRSWFGRFLHDMIIGAFDVPGLFGGRDNLVWRWLT